MNFDADNFDAIFFDLDGTLLGLSDDAFEGVYTKLIAKRFMDELDPDHFIKALWEGTEAMLAQNGSDDVVLNAFFNKFTELTGMSRKETYKRFDAFYRNEFDQLSEVCEPVPEARELMDELQHQDIKVVLATNPVFPEIATRKRCQWTDIDYDEFEYVSHAENSYSCKPSLAYYSRILEIVNVPAERTLMVGNDYLFDMAASELGIKTWMIEQFRGNTEYQGKFKVDYNGSLKLLLDYI